MTMLEGVHRTGGQPDKVVPLTVDQAGRAAVSASARGSDGAVLDIDSLAQTLAYNGDGTLNYVQVVHEGSTYRQTMTYTSGKLTGISGWVKQ